MISCCHRIKIKFIKRANKTWCSGPFLTSPIYCVFNDHLRTGLCASFCKTSVGGERSKAEMPELQNKGETTKDAYSPLPSHPMVTDDRAIWGWEGPLGGSALGQTMRKRGSEAAQALVRSLSGAGVRVILRVKKSNFYRIITQMQKHLIVHNKGRKNLNETMRCLSKEPFKRKDVIN